MTVTPPRSSCGFRCCQPPHSMTPLPVIGNGPAMPVMVDRLYLMVRVTWAAGAARGGAERDVGGGDGGADAGGRVLGCGLGAGRVIGDGHDPDAVAGRVGEGDLGVVGAAEFDGSQHQHQEEGQQDRELDGDCTAF